MAVPRGKHRLGSKAESALTANGRTAISAWIEGRRLAVPFIGRAVMDPEVCTSRNSSGEAYTQLTARVPYDGFNSASAVHTPLRTACGQGLGGTSLACTGHGLDPRMCTNGTGV